MRIGIDARELCGHFTGVGRHLAGLLTAWGDAAGAARHTFILYAHQSVATALPSHALLRECLESGAVDEAMLREEMRRNHLRHDALDLLGRTPPAAA